MSERRNKKVKDDSKMANSKKVMETMLGSTMLTSLDKTESTSTVLNGKDLVILYFSASWCPPCQAFTPDLSKFYTKYCVPSNVEVIYISADRDIPSFNEYYGKMPWASLPIMGSASVKQKLADSLKLSGYPTVVVLDAKTGYFISDDARNEVSSVMGDNVKSKELIASWKKIEAVPIEDAELSSSGPQGLLMKTIKKIMSNPTYMIGLYILGKKLMKYLQELGNEEEEL